MVSPKSNFMASVSDSNLHNEFEKMMHLKVLSHIPGTLCLWELCTCCIMWCSWFPPELPSLLPITEVVEALLHVPNGIWLASRLVANVPDTFEEGKLSMLHLQKNVCICSQCHFTIFNPRPLRPKGYCRHLRLSVCPSVHLSVCLSVCSHHPC